ncbi:MAG: GNAT family N-acetyltransferase [Spirochaetia bacterium]|nr:GNAT family N-acetyltransferase [Spirochaetia bacterium]
MKVRPASSSDMERIMKIEENAFILNIQETYQTFSCRMTAFPQGFLVLEDDRGAVQGYFSSELWEKLPDNNKVFILDHDPLKVHKADGKLLYVSSFALMGSLRGRGLGKLFFRECLKEVRKAAPQIDQVILIVSQEWGSARHIYEELGFKSIRQIPGFFPSDIIPGGADGIVMIKTLEENV